jgi:tetratricopeptide (TPR) repeat protein/transglutaminase-like putative cysteine protease
MNRLPLIAFAAVQLAFLVIPGAAQQKSTSSPEKPAPVGPDFSKEPLVYEQVRGHLRYENDGDGTTDVYARIRVQSYSGVQRVGQLVFNYDSANASLEIRTLRVTKPDGQVITAGPEAIQDMSSPVAESAPTYTDLRQKHVVVPSLSPGDLLEYETHTTYHPLTPGKIWQVWDFVSENICVDERVEISVPTKFSIKTSTTGANAPEMKSEGDRTVWTWKTSQLSHLDRPLVIPPAGKMFPDVKTLLRTPYVSHPRRASITSFANWREISDWYAGLESDRRLPDAAIHAKAEELTRNSHSDLEKTRAIYEYVARSIRYVSLSFGVGRYQPHAAAEVLAHQYGDCKDKATLLESMLQSLGIEAYPVLLQASGYMEDVYSPREFDHAITYLVLDGKELWLDSTLGVAPFGYLLPNVRGKRALVVSPDKGSKLRTIPNELPAPNIYRFGLDGSIDADRKLGAKMTFETRGDWEVLLRLGLSQMSMGQLQAAMEAGMKKSGKADEVILSELDATDPYDTSSPLRLQVRMTAIMPDEKDKAGSGGSKKEGSKPNPFSPDNLDDFIALLLPLPAENYASPLGDPEELAFHIQFRFGGKLSDRISEKLKTQKITPVHLTQDFAEYEQSWSWQPPLLSGDMQLARKMRSVSGERKAEYSAFRAAVKAQMAEVVYALGVPRPAGVPTEEVMRYSDALRNINAGKKSEGKDVLEALLKDDPKYQDAWRSLGKLEASQHHWVKSRKAYEKLVELAPQDYSAYEGLIQSYANVYDYDQAISIAKKEIAALPQEADGHTQLGWLYLQTEKNSLAAPEYEAAAKILPKSSRIQILLGRAYGGSQQLDKAAVAFDRANELDSSFLTLNDTAYYASELGLDLKIAEQRAEKAVTGIEKQLNAVKVADVKPATLNLLRLAAAYWDTMGWIKYKQGDVASAERYLRAASDLTDALTIQMHMGRIEEALGHKERAIQFYLTALETTQVVTLSVDPDGKMVSQPAPKASPDEQESRNRLTALAGSSQKVEELLKEASYNRNWKRTVTVPFTESQEQREQVVLILSPGPKIASSAILPESKEQSKLLSRFGNKIPPQTFPDENVTRIPRVANIHCLTNPVQCEFEFLPTEQSSSAFATQVQPQ